MDRDPRLDYIFAALDDAKIGNTTAVRLFDNAVTRVTLLQWRQGNTTPKIDLQVKVVHGYAQLIRKAIERKMLPLKGSMPVKEKYAALKTILRTMNEIK